MTREEAMQELQNCKGLIQQDGQDYLDERDIPLLDMAIEALSADAVGCTDFVNWLLEEVMDEEMWELNAVANGEIICRKLEKLGFLEATEEPSYYIRPSADAVSREDADMLVGLRNFKEHIRGYNSASADAVHIHNDGTLEVKVPNAQKVGRVLVMDTDSHIGGGLFYPDDAVPTVICPNCGARMKGGEDE